MNGAGEVVDGWGRRVASRVFLSEELEGLALFNMPNDQDGVLLFNEGGNCAACHPGGPITEPTDSQGKTLFTDFSYDDLGIPVNPTANTLHFASDMPAADLITKAGRDIPPRFGLSRIQDGAYLKQQKMRCSRISTLSFRKRALSLALRRML